MPLGVQLSEEQYSSWTGLVYVFNLMVGTGALTLPAVLDRAGWGLGSLVITVLAFMSYITCTFVVEAMSTANAVSKWRQHQHLKRLSSATQSEGEESHEETPLVSTEIAMGDKIVSQPCKLYEITERIEMGQMADIFFNKFGRTIFYMCLVVYLYGDLAIYSAAVSKSLVDVSCDARKANTTMFDDDNICWHKSNGSIDRVGLYRIFLGVFLVVLGPFVFFNVQKTKYLQMITTVMRWLAFSIMICYASYRLVIHGPLGHPPSFALSGAPGLFGACVYSFMCHHSLPALISPIADKSRLSRGLAFDYILIAGFYLVLALTGIYAFAHLDDLYTLDFAPAADTIVSWPLAVIQYFLALFPVFTLSTSFPVIAITLSNNLRALCLTEGRRYGVITRYFLFPVLAIVPPLLISLTTEDLELLVKVTGSYAGTGIQYLIPAFLVASARREAARLPSPGPRGHPHLSPFAHSGWIIFVIIWAIACSAFVTVDLIERIV